MRCHLLIPHAVWPNRAESAEVTVGLTLPAFSRLAGRGRRESFVAISASDWLGQAFGLNDFPAAPLTLMAASADKSAGFWLRVDPVHLSINQRGAEIADPDALAVTQHEATQLIAALNAQFAEDGLYFVAAAPDAWLLRLPEVPESTFTPLESVYGRSIGEFLPQGPDAVRWHRLINEIQMLLYAHPVNDTRAGQGRPLINSLWLWGGGMYPLPDALRKPAGQVKSDDPLLATLTTLAGGHATSCPGSFSGIDGKDTLVVLDELTLPALWRDALSWREGWAALEQDWFAPALGRLRDGTLAELIITLPEAGVRMALRRGDLWLIWRRPWLPWL